MKNITDEDLQLAAVKNNRFVFEYLLISKIPLSENVQIDAVKQNGCLIKRLLDANIKLSEDVQLSAVIQNYRMIEYIENPSEAIQLEAVKRNWKMIEHIQNPSEAVQLEAVKQNYRALDNIRADLITEKVQLTAIKCYSHYYNENDDNDNDYDKYKKKLGKIAVIEKLLKIGVSVSEELQLLAVKEKGHLIKHIKNPSEQVKKTAVEKEWSVIKYLLDENNSKNNNNISEDILLAVVKQCGKAMSYLEKYNIMPSKEVQIAAVKENWVNITLIKNPIEEVILAATEKNWKTVYYIKKEDLSEKIKLAAVNQNYKAIKYLLKNKISVSEDIQLAAVRQNGFIILNLFIFNADVTEKVKIEAVKQNWHSIKHIKKYGEISEEVEIAANKNREDVDKKKENNIDENIEGTSSLSIDLIKIIDESLKKYLLKKNEVEV